MTTYDSEYRIDLKIMYANIDNLGTTLYTNKENNVNEKLFRIFFSRYCG